VGVRRGATALAGARSAEDVRKLLGMATDSWIELMGSFFLAGSHSGETPDSYEPGRECDKSEIRVTLNDS